MMESRITCRLCTKVYIDPKLTPCLHTVCLQCLDNIGQENPYSPQIECPVCKSEIQKPSGGNGFASFPCDIYTARLLEIYSPNIESSKILCSQCGKKTDLFSYCFDCELFFCQKCSRHTDSHRIIKREDLNEKDQKAVICRPLSCNHEQSRGEKSVEIYCRHCLKCICKDCSAITQEKHDQVSPLTEEYDKAYKDLQSAIDKVSERSKEIKDGKNLIQQRINELDNQVNIVKKDVHAGIEKLIDLLKQHEKEMFQQIDDVCNEKKENLNSQLETSILSLIQVTSSIDFAQDMLQRKISGEIVSLKDYVQKRLEQLSRLRVDARPVESASVGYIPNKDVLRHINSSVLGQIASSNTDASATISSGEGLREGAVGEETSFTVTTCDIKSDPCYSDIDVMNVIVTAPEGPNIESRIKNKENGFYEVTYVPPKPGKYDVIVQVNGKDIRGSPFQVHIRPPILMPLKAFGSNTGGAGMVTQPHGVAVSDKGEIAFTDTKKNCIHVFDMEWRKILDIGEYGSDDGQLNYPAGITFDKSQKCLIVADRDNNRVQIFNRKSGKLVKKFGTYGSGNGQFNKPTGISIDKSGRVIVTDWMNHRVQVFTTEGKFLFNFGNDIPEKLKHPRDAIFCESQNVFVVSDTGNNVLKTFDKKGTFLHSIGKPGNKKGELYSPRGLAVDSEQRLIVCDFDNHRIQFFNLKDRKALSSYGSKGTNIGQFSNPIAVASIPDEKVIVTDWRNDRLQVFSMGPMWKMAYLCDRLGQNVV